MTPGPHDSPLPDTAGLRALAHVGDPTPAPDHSAFWAHWFRVTASNRPVLTRRTPNSSSNSNSSPDDSDPAATHEFISLGGVRIACRLTLPPLPVRSGVVLVHGLEDVPPLDAEDRRAAALAARGLAVLVIRLRGFPGSRAGLSYTHFSDARSGWFAAGLDNPERSPDAHLRWVIPGAVADVVNACRALRTALAGRAEGVRLDVAPGTRPAVALRGTSLGAGLCVIAAAQLMGKLPQERVVERLVLSTPGLGDWPWRLTQAQPIGIAESVRTLLAARPDLAPVVLDRLRLCDSVVHAARVRCPVLCKLAARDAVLPPHAAAAVYNALAADPGQKWRFLVEHGHDGLAAPGARRHALFERAAADFLDPALSPEQAMTPWEDALSAIGTQAPPTGTGVEQGALFAAGTRDAADAALIAAYVAAALTLDALPYTPAFAAIVAATGLSERDTLHRLHTLRKAGRLPRLGRAQERPPRLDPAHEAVLAELVCAEVATLGQRDRLPHTQAFDRLVTTFNARTGLALAAHDVWRVVARMAK